MDGIRAGVLIALCLQNASHALLARYAQGYLKETFSSTDVVLAAEIIKCIVSAVIVMNDHSSSQSHGIKNGIYRLIHLLQTGKSVLVLVVLYSAANILSYYALARVDAAVYAVLAQLKILTTAAFSVLVLRRSFSWTKWRALFLLVLGCVLVASPAFNHSQPQAKTISPVDETLQNSKFADFLSGVVSILVLVCISGYSAVYFEGMLKAEPVTIWERNFQLAVYSCALMFGVIAFNGLYSSAPPSFQGWTFNATLLSFISAAGGLLVAATLKYADSVLKTLATSGSIVLSAVLGHFMLGADLDVFVTIGCIATILAICNYTFEETASTMNVLPVTISSK